MLEDAGAFLEPAGPAAARRRGPAQPDPRHRAARSAESPDRYAEKRFWVAVEDGEPVAAAIQTPPYNLILATPRDDAALAALAAAIEDELPGVTGTRPEVDAFARLWTDAHGLETRTLRGMGVYALERVQPVPPAPGSSRPATRDDEALLLDWMIAFGEEVLEETDPGRTEARAAVEHRLAGHDGGFLLWEDERRAVSVSGWGGPTPNGIRVGPVYTPPELRGRGYATALVAELSQTLLDGGRQLRLPLHRPGEPDVERDLRAHRLRPGRRVGDGRVPSLPV